MRLPGGVRSIGARAFAGTNVSIVALPNSLTHIDEDAFAEMIPRPLLMVHKGSYAEQWVTQRDFLFSYLSD